MSATPTVIHLTPDGNDSTETLHTVTEQLLNDTTQTPSDDYIQSLASLR